MSVLRLFALVFIPCVLSACRQQGVYKECEGKMLHFCRGADSLQHRECSGECVEDRCIVQKTRAKATKTSVEKGEDAMDWKTVDKGFEACTSESVSQTTKVGKHTSDLVAMMFDASLDGVGKDAIVSIQLEVTGKTRSDGKDVRCRARDVQLKRDTDQGAAGKTSGDRATEHTYYQKTETKHTYGLIGDVWDVYGYGETLNRENLMAHLDLSVESITGNGGNATCSINCVELVVEHAPTHKTPMGAHAQLGSGIGHAFTLVPKRAVWSFYDHELPPKEGWWDVDYITDKTWALGKDGKKAGDYGQRKGDNKLNKDAHVAYFRHEFKVEFGEGVNVTAIDCFRMLRLQSKFDAGARVWLNGALMWEYNMLPLAESDGPMEYHRAIRESRYVDDGEFIVAHFPEDVLLRPGKNVLAIAVFESAQEKDHGKLLMDMSLAAITTCPPPASAVDLDEDDDDGTDAPGEDMRALSEPMANPSTSPTDDLGGVEEVKGSSAGSIVLAIVAVIFCAAGFGAYYYVVVRKQSILSV